MVLSPPVTVDAPKNRARPVAITDSVNVRATAACLSAQVLDFAELSQDGAFGRLTKSVLGHSRLGHAPFRNPAVAGVGSELQGNKW
jgi:hypothetical protein